MIGMWRGILDRIWTRAERIFLIQRERLAAVAARRRLMPSPCWPLLAWLQSGFHHTRFTGFGGPLGPLLAIQSSKYHAYYPNDECLKTFLRND